MTITTTAATTFTEF